MPADDQELPLILMKNFPKECDCDAVLVQAHKFTFGKALVEQIEKEYRESPDPKLMKICKLL